VGEEGLALLDQVEEVYRRAITTARPQSIILVGRYRLYPNKLFKEAS
jgi:hypothetical protein